MFTCIGNTIGKCGISIGDCLTNQQINSVVPNESHDPKFLYYLLHYNREAIRGIGIGGGAATPIINKSTFSSVKFSVPEDKDVQKSIASTLSAYDDLIENNRRRIALLEDAARQLYKEWFVRFRFPGHEHVPIVDGVPEGWEASVASNAMEVLSGGTPKTAIDEFWGGDIPFFTPKDTTGSIYVNSTEKMLTERGLEACASSLFSKGTVFITARGTVGKLNLAQRPMAMNQSCYALVAKEPLNQTFLYFALDAAIRQFKARAVGAVFDAIIKDTFNVIPFAVPPEKMVREFTEVVEDNVSQIDNLLAQNDRLRDARDILLPKLMSGEIAV